MNDIILRHYMKPNSITEQKLIMDHLRVNNSKPFNTNMTFDLIKSVKATCQRYDEFLEQEK